MGLLDRFADKVAVKSAELVKADQTDAAVKELTEKIEKMNADNQNRRPAFFGAGKPMRAIPANTDETSGGAGPRRNQFQVSTNINVTQDLVQFSILRQCAEKIDILTRCVHIKKSKCLGWDWDIVLSDDATDSIANDQSVSREAAAVLAREKFAPEIARVKAFWKNPDPLSGQSFIQWFSQVLDEVLVLDALTIYPQKTVGGDLLAFQIIDGATIKPIIDDRGFRPQPPDVAFQQILYGLPRSDFIASIDSSKVKGEFDTSELFYAVQNPRTTSSYGNSPVERALTMGDIYLRRQDWIRAEYTDGVTPDIFMKTDVNFGTDIGAMNAYEENFNDALRGQTSARQGVKLLPTGMEPVQMASYAERFKASLDEYLIGAIASHFGLSPIEVGLIPQHSGLSSHSGDQKSQDKASEAMGDAPLAKWFADIFSKLSWLYLGAPQEIEFSFTSSTRDDNLSLAQGDDIDLKNGKMTINEARSKSGRSLIESDQADQPMLITQLGNFFVTDDGLVPFVAPPEPTPQSTPTLDENGQPVVQGTQVDEHGATVTNDNAGTKPASKPTPSPEPTVSEKAMSEMRACSRWLDKSPKRPFNFEFVPATYGEVINKFVVAGDFDSAKYYADRYIA